MEEEAGAASAVRTWSGDGWQAQTLGIIHTEESEVRSYLARLVEKLALRQEISEIDLLSGRVGTIIMLDNSERAYLISDWLGSENIYYEIENEKIKKYGFYISQLNDLPNSKVISDAAMDEFFSYRGLNSGRTLLESIKIVPPGCVVYIEQDRRYKIKKFAQYKYGNTPKIAEDGNIGNWIRELDNRFNLYFEMISKRYNKVGVLLSGGVDSSLLLAKLRQYGKLEVTALSAPFYDDDEKVEIQRAQEVAKLLNITHKMPLVNEKYISDLFPLITYVLEMPITYFNIYARMRLMEQAKESGVQLVLSGEGADSMFGNEVGGDAQLLRLQKLRDVLAYTSPWARDIVGWVGRRIGGRVGALIDQATVAGVPQAVQEQGQIFRLGGGINSRECVERVMPLLCRVRQNRKGPIYDKIVPTDGNLEIFQRNLILYTRIRHQHYTCAKLAHYFGIDFDCPFLSDPISELGFRVPAALRSDERGSKPILRRMLLRYVPERIVYAPKRGWETGGTRWLWGPLRKWQDILTDEVAERRGIYDTAAIRSADWKGNEHVLWSLMSFEMFLRVFMDGSGRPLASTSLPAA